MTQASNKEKLLDNKRWQLHMQAVAENADRKAFQALYNHFAPKIKSFYIQHGFAHQAEEMTQEVFIKVWNRASTYKGDKANVSTWIFTIARNYRIDVLRQNRIDTISDEFAPEMEDEDNIEDTMQFDQSSDTIKQAMASLDLEQRMVLQKVYFEDKSHQIAADELEMTPGVVKSRIRSALKSLRQKIGGEHL